MPSYFNARTESFEEVTIFDQPALFTPIRIKPDSIPSGYYLYDVRHDDDWQGDAVQIALHIRVNHWGSLITRYKIELPPDGFLDIEPEDLRYGAGDCRNLAEFIKKYPSREV